MATSRRGTRRNWRLSLIPCSVWLLAGKASAWFRDLGTAAEYVERHQAQDVYVGVALSPQDFGPHQRCKAEATAGIVGLWLDLDYQGEAHKKPNLPPSLQDALSLIPPDLPPTLVVHSGHGAQAWWLFDKPWIFVDAQDRDKSAQMADDLKVLVKGRGGEKGWDVDAVADLARVMRVAGTTNTKVKEDHRPLEIAQMSDRRYSREAIRGYLNTAVAALPAPAPVKAAATTTPPSTNDDLVLDPAAEPPFQKFELLCEVEPRFRDSWNHQRGADLQDKSASGYDMSLANFAAQAKWPNQEIANLLIAHRRKYGEPPKLVDRLIDDLTDFEDMWRGLGRHANPVEPGRVVHMQTGATDYGSFAVAAVAAAEGETKVTGLLIVVPVEGLSTISMSELRGALRPIPERVRKAIVGEVLRAKALAAKDHSAPALAFSVPIGGAQPATIESALHDFERLLIRALIVWIEENLGAYSPQGGATISDPRTPSSVPSTPLDARRPVACRASGYCTCCLPARNCGRDPPGSGPRPRNGPRGSEA